MSILRFDMMERRQGWEVSVGGCVLRPESKVKDEKLGRGRRFRVSCDVALDKEVRGDGNKGVKDGDATSVDRTSEEEPMTTA